jgi:hypothetical protein
MVKTLYPPKKQAKTGMIRGAVRLQSGVYHVDVPAHQQGGFRFPSKNMVKIVTTAKADTAAAKTGLKRLRKTYKSAGHEIMGTTEDGIVIVRPSGKPDSFRITDLREAVSRTINTKGRRNSI